MYIAGVVEAESGTSQNLEYYKVQSVICRTYALANKTRHAQSGYHLCDAVHCQVYHGMAEINPDITSATMETSDVVVVDQDINLITTAFHSNCGGQTINSEDVWSKSVPYLKAVTDTFCLDMRNSTWTKNIKTANWMGFLRKKGITHQSDSLRKFAFSHHRTHFAPQIHLKDIRSAFQLKSTYFQASEQNGSMNFKGRGYGHGVGLCQEGAMKMSTLGYDYIEILHFYFTDIHVVPLSNFHLFKEEE
jgi:stage II sporulation protein D